jgi:hypothetical protein
MQKCQACSRNPEASGPARAEDAAAAVCLTVTRPAAILLVTSFKGDMLSVSKFIGAAV